MASATRITAVALLAATFCSSAVAAGLVFGGDFNDPANTALMGSDLGPALFGDDWEIANNVALYDLTVPADGFVNFNSVGYAAGGAEPYFTLFAGTGAAATFLDSNYLIADVDFSLTRFLSAGDYRLALGVWENESFAENYYPDPSLTLGDGFIALGEPGLLGNYHYELQVTLDSGPPGVPEPSTLLLMAAGMVALTRARHRILSMV